MTVYGEGDKTLVDFWPPAGMREENTKSGFLTHHDGVGRFYRNDELLNAVYAARRAREESGYTQPVVTGFSREALLPPWQRNMKRLWTRFIDYMLIG